MSNLYKSQFVISNKDNTRVIDSNDMSDAYMQEYIRIKREEELAEGGFVEGLGAEEVEVIEQESSEEVLPEETISKEEEAAHILEEAKEEANGILEDAKLQAEHMREQALSEGKEEGYKEGRDEAYAEIAAKQQQLESLEQSLKADYEKQVEELEPALVEVITDVVEKVFGIQFSDQKNVLLYLIQNAVMHADSCKEFRIHVGEDSYTYVSAHKAELMERVGADLRLDIIEDTALGENQCEIETDAGVFDCGVGVQMKNLIKEIRTLSL